MHNHPTFSLVIPTYNRATFIAKTLDSVCKQTFSDFEVLIIDDGSTDNTKEVVEKYIVDSRFQYFKKNNGERAAARNYGIQRSRGKFITFLDSDDILLPNHFAIAQAKIEEHKNLEIFHLAYEIYNGNNDVFRLPTLQDPVNTSLIDGNHLSCLGVFIKNEIAQANLFDEERALSGSEDFELWLRIAIKYPIRTFTEVTSRLINHDSRSVKAIEVEKLKKRLDLLQEKALISLKANPLFAVKTDKFISYRLLYQALHLVMAGFKREAISDVFSAIKHNPNCLFSYRLGVIVKKIVFN